MWFDCCEEYFAKQPKRKDWRHRAVTYNCFDREILNLDIFRTHDRQGCLCWELGVKSIRCSEEGVGGRVDGFFSWGDDVINSPVPRPLSHPIATLILLCQNNSHAPLYFVKDGPYSIFRFNVGSACFTHGSGASQMLLSHVYAWSTGENKWMFLSWRPLFWRWRPFFVGNLSSFNMSSHVFSF